MQVDHIEAASMAGEPRRRIWPYACFRCDPWKGSDVGSLDPRMGGSVSLFHPRRPSWADHEQLAPEGHATARLLRLNLDLRVSERRLLVAAGRYPR